MGRECGVGVKQGPQLPLAPSSWTPYVDPWACRPCVCQALKGRIGQKNISNFFGATYQRKNAWLKT